MTRILTVSTSLHPESRSRAILQMVGSGLKRIDGVETDHADLLDIPLPFCDGRHPVEAYGENAKRLSEQVGQADALVFGMAVYCYSVSGVLKNFLDICCGGMTEKPFGIICASGGSLSYMAVEDLQKILMFEVRGIPFPRVVFAANEDWSEEGERAEGLLPPIPERVKGFVQEFVPFVRRLSHKPKA
ncbi:NAD(P)H-dependent oxidoreductase [bacterium]|nr:NAD(P)H-dependent oxidoreductase [bacterium]